jgi:hypothetical protein
MPEPEKPQPEEPKPQPLDFNAIIPTTSAATSMVAPMYTGPFFSNHDG